MAKQLRCDDIIPGCPEVIEGKDDNEVMQKAREHAKSAHHIVKFSPDVVSKVQQAIQTK
jgi:predicted small metal-binding protein